MHEYMFTTNKHFNAAQSQATAVCEIDMRSWVFVCICMYARMFAAAFTY